MIYVRLMGGLGNQMFQYAFGRQLSANRDGGVVFDLSYFQNPPKGDVPRQFELDVLHAEPNLAPRPVKPARYLLGRLTGRPQPIIEPNGFQPDLLRVPDNVLLIGYWQSEKYFKGVERQIREEFRFR